MPRADAKAAPVITTDASHLPITFVFILTYYFFINVSVVSAPDGGKEQVDGLVAIAALTVFR
jgi:hypothetical protein